MTRFFTRQRFGRPQFLAGALLLAFLAQAIWLVHSELRGDESGAYSLSASEQVRIAAGWRQIHGGGIAGAPFPDVPGSLPIDVARDSAGFDTEHSPLLSLLTAAPLLAWPQALAAPESSPHWRWLPRIPFLAFGVFLGASLWYVARRLCGNSGGFLALTLYCFSPAVLQATAVWHAEPEILAAWGSFGAIFTAIAVAHTLYAPREVVLWNWRRIVLLGISLAIAVGSQFSMIVVVPIALAFLLYLAPIRRGAAFTIWIGRLPRGSHPVVLHILFHTHAFLQGMQHASFWGATWRSFTVLAVYRRVAMLILRVCPAFVLLIRRPRSQLIWRGRAPATSATPLRCLSALLFIILGIAHPRVAGAGFLLASIPFLFIFVSGVLADLMETPFRALVTACLWAWVGLCILGVLQL